MRVNDRKRELRETVLRRLELLDRQRMTAASADVCRRTVSLECFRRARRVMIYVPLSKEVDVRPIAEACWSAGVNVAVPRTQWASRRMEPVEIRGFDGLVETRNGLFEPPAEARSWDPDSIDLIVVPGLAFDTGCHRLGRGAGFYDRFLAPLTARTVGVAFEEQMVDDVPTDEHDVVLDVVVTDRRVAQQE